MAASTAVLRLQKGGLRMVIAEAEGMVASDPKQTLQNRFRRSFQLIGG